MRSKSQILSKLRADGHITDEEYKMLEQEPKTGHWIEDEYEMEVRCSVCGEENDMCSKYCPNCGTKMIEPQERSDEK